MKNSFIYIILLSYAFLMYSCGDINENHDLYLQDGETIYIAKADSLDVLGGNGRILLRSYTHNPAIKYFAVFWDQEADSLIVPVEGRTSPNYFDIMIGDTENPIEERGYVFEIYSRDDKGHRSIKTEAVGEAYGSTYQSSLLNHAYESVNFDPQTNQLAIAWYASIDETEIGIEINYKNVNTSNIETVKINLDDLGSETLLTNIDRNHLVSYRTIFLPSPTAIDTFYTDFEKIEVKATTNVALLKNATASSILNASYPASNAVDGGDLVNPSRWVSGDNKASDQWLIVDLGQEYPISGCKILINYLAPPNFMLQAEINGEWVTVVSETSNSKLTYETTFPEVSTSRVRYYIPAIGSVDYVRLYEIEIYSVITY